MQQYDIVLEEKLQAVTEEVLNVEERAAQMEQLHRDQEKHLKVRTMPLLLKMNRIANCIRCAKSYLG